MKSALKIRKRINKKDLKKEVKILLSCELNGDTISAGRVYLYFNVDAVLRNWHEDENLNVYDAFKYLFGSENIRISEGHEYKFSLEFMEIIKVIRTISIHRDGSALLTDKHYNAILSVIAPWRIHKYGCGAFIFNKEDMAILEWLGAKII